MPSLALIVPISARKVAECSVILVINAASDTSLERTRGRVWVAAAGTSGEPTPMSPTTTNPAIGRRVVVRTTLNNDEWRCS
jgi:hypothetical protein